MAETEASVKSIAWASARLAAVAFLFKFTLTIYFDGMTKTLERWYVEVGYFVLVFAMTFVVFLLLSRFDKKQVEKEKGTKKL